MPTPLFLLIWEPRRHVHAATGLQSRMRMLSKRKPAHARTRREKNRETKITNIKLDIHIATPKCWKTQHHKTKEKALQICLESQHHSTTTTKNAFPPQTCRKSGRGLAKVKKCNATEHGKHTKKRTPRSTGTPFLTFATPHEEYAPHV